MFSEGPCYFSIIPSPYIQQPLDSQPGTPASCFYSPVSIPDETSISTPGTPTAFLLPSRDPSISGVLSPTTEISLMQRQTSVAHKSMSSRPKPQPVQNVLHVTSDDSNSALSSSSDNSFDSSTAHMASELEFARCSRCQRSASLNSGTGNKTMVQYGLNLWYCIRCAAMVGLAHR